MMNQPTTPLALAGTTVLELGQAFMGPYCALLLQRLGADVIKIEPPQGEPYRRPTIRKGTEAAQFGMLNAGKRSLCIDLKHPEGREVFVELAKQADVVVQNYAPGTFDRLIGIEALMEANPRLIVASGSGYGSTGPYSDRRAMDLTIQAMAGVMATTGFEDSPPVRTGPSVVDFMGASHLVSAILGALLQRVNTGRGQQVEVALYDAILPSLSSNFGGYFDTDGEIPERTGNRHGGLAFAPYNAYETADGWMAILCLHDRHWRTMCEVMGQSHLADDPQLSTNAQRAANMERVDAIVGAWTTTLPTADAVDALNAAGIPCAPVASLEDVLNDPQVKARGMLELHKENDYEWWTLGSPLRLQDSPSPEHNVPARLGEHTGEILSATVGLSPERIEQLKNDGVVIQSAAGRASAASV